MVYLELSPTYSMKLGFLAYDWSHVFPKAQIYILKLPFTHGSHTSQTQLPSNNSISTGLTLKDRVLLMKHSIGTTLGQIGSSTIGVKPPTATCNYYPSIALGRSWIKKRFKLNGTLMKTSRALKSELRLSNELCTWQQTYVRMEQSLVDPKLKFRHLRAFQKLFLGRKRNSLRWVCCIDE